MGNNDFIDSVSNRFRYESFSNFATEVSKCITIENLEEVLRYNVKYILSSYQFIFLIYTEKKCVRLNQKVDFKPECNLGELIFNKNSSTPLIIERTNRDNSVDQLIHYLFKEEKNQSIVRVNKQLDNIGFLAYVTSKEAKAYSLSDIKFLKLICELVLSKTQSILLSQKLIQQNEDLKAANLDINQKNITINSSIKYAALIQRALLQNENSIKKSFQNSFIFFQPKDIVGGDFYFSYSYHEYTLLVAADCTGHGVPGAILSIFGLQLLREYCNTNKDFTPSVILKTLDTNFKNQLRGTESTLLQDGMDVSIILVNNKAKTLTFSAAFGALLYLKKGENNVTTIKGDRLPIGDHIFYSEKKFNDHTINYSEGDRFYIYTDGYKDQFGGPKEEKYKIFRFKNLIESNSMLPFDNQKELFKSTFNQWKGNHFQIDDVLVLGVEL